MEQATQKKLNVGDVVMIYEDPITQNRPEGDAQIKKIDFEDEEFYHCEVKFKGDGPHTRYIRKIAK